MNTAVEDTIRYTFSDINQLISNLCTDMEQDGWIPDIIIGVSRGGLLPGTMISYYFDKPFKALNWDAGCEPDISVFPEWPFDQNILIVDDICNTGDTLDSVLSSWEGELPLDEELDLGGNVRLATINFVRSCDFEVDYIGEFIRDERVLYPTQEWWQ